MRILLLLSSQCGRFCIGHSKATTAICPLKICGCLHSRNKILVTITCNPRWMIAQFHMKKSVIWLCFPWGKLTISFLWLCGDGVTSFFEYIDHSNIPHDWTCLAWVIHDLTVMDIPSDTNGHWSCLNHKVTSMPHKN